MKGFSFLFALAAAFHSNAYETEAHIKAAAAACGQAQTAMAEHHFAAAVESFRKAIAVEPTFEAAHEGLIEAYLGSHQPLEAAGAITRFLEIEPNSPRYRLVLGQILLEVKQPEKALAQFSIVLKTDPFNSDALLGFAAAADGAGLPGKAAEAFERGRRRYPADNRFKSAPGVRK